MRHRAPEIVSIDAGVMKRWRCIIYAAIGMPNASRQNSFARIAILFP